MKQPTDINEMLNEFEFAVEGEPSKGATTAIDIKMGTAEEIAAEAKLEEEATAEALRIANEGKTPEEIAETEKTEAEAEALRLANEGKSEEEIQVEKDALALAAREAQKGNNSHYKNIALKYIEKGTWSEELAIDDGEGNVVLVKDLEELDEDTFFQIEESVKTQEKEDNKTKFISVEGMNARRKNIIDIVKEGGDLTSIFRSESELNEYLNPFDGVDLDNTAVQERVYFNALISHNKLDNATAQLIVDNAKKDLTLDTKVKDYVEGYTVNWDKFVEGKKASIQEAKKEENKVAKEFKKSLQAKYKEFEIKDTLARKLADSAVNKKDGEYEIDSLYAKRMENPEEAAELILFITDKQAYLDLQLNKKIIKEHKKVRQIIKLIPKPKTTKKEDTVGDKGDNEFEFEVKT